MDDRLLVPATRALLEGWVGPVVAHGQPGVTYAADGEKDWLVVNDDPTHDPADRMWCELRTVPLDGIALDLSRAECRDRVARVLATWCTGPTIAPHFGWDNGDRVWMLGGVAFRRVDVREPFDTRLPDGSRLVDALALAAVAREVLRG